jgi:cation diffusion facilitator CzcD-associated flavoprotein CzcO
MGATTSKSIKMYNKRVVIVGFSYSGLTIAELLWDHVNVTIID